MPEIRLSFLAFHAHMVLWYTTAITTKADIAHNTLTLFAVLSATVHAAVPGALLYNFVRIKLYLKKKNEELYVCSVCCARHTSGKYAIHPCVLSSFIAFVQHFLKLTHPMHFDYMYIHSIAHVLCRIFSVIVCVRVCVHNIFGILSKSSQLNIDCEDGVIAVSKKHTVFKHDWKFRLQTLMVVYLNRQNWPPSSRYRLLTFVCEC